MAAVVTTLIDVIYFKDDPLGPMRMTSAHRGAVFNALHFNLTKVNEQPKITQHDGPTAQLALDRELRQKSID